MDSYALITKFQSNPLFKPTIYSTNHLPFPIPKPISTNTQIKLTIKLKASLSSTKPIIHKLKTTAATLLFAAALIGKFRSLPAKAETQQVLTQEIPSEEEKIQEEEDSSNFLESRNEAVEALTMLLQQNLESGDNLESLKILKDLVLAQPDESIWKISMARLLSKMGDTKKAEEILDEILSKNPHIFEALFEYSLLMGSNGEGEEAIRRLEEVLKLGEEEGKGEEAREVRLIVAQMQLLQKNFEEALCSYEELTKEDPDDFRPYYCKGVIYDLLDKNAEAAEQFERYCELLPNKFEVEAYLRTALLKMKPNGTGSDEVNSN